MHLDDATAALIAAGRRLGARGLISAGEGNLSIRLDGGRLLVTPTGRRKDELGPDDLVLIRLGHPAAPMGPPARAPASPHPRTCASIWPSTPPDRTSWPSSTPTCRPRWR